MSHGIHCFITGRVQGVWFRATTKERAESLQINGWVSNLPDGRVEVFAYGQPDALDALVEFLTVGPPQAEVIGIDKEIVEFQEIEGFWIK